MRGFTRAAAISLPLALSACGGGGGGGVASSSTTAPTTSTPAPTNTSLATLQYSQTFSAAPAGLLTVAQKGTGTVSAASTEPANAGAITLSYDASTQSYTVKLNSYSQTFAPSDRDATSSNTTITAYTKKTGNLTENFGLFNAGSGNTKLALTYTSYGALQRLVDNGTSVSVTQDYFVYGIPTAAADLPRTGTATYQTVLDGSWASEGDLRALTGTSALTADFAAGTTSLRLTLGGVSVINGASKQLDTFTGTGRIDTSNASFAGALSPTTSTYSGAYTGQFFGPGATEAGASFNLTNGSGGVVAGAVVGHK